MCGICGIVGEANPALVSHMSDVLGHRGPDDHGLWTAPKGNATLGHRRLSILDLSPAGQQPMSNEDGSIRLVFNGEIYNFQELRHQLESRGHRFRSKTDSEVLVHLYEERGEELVHELNGMFAFAIWDSREDKLLIARDHAGIKPLYFHQRGDTLLFASEIKALLQDSRIPRRLNADAVPAYLRFLWVPGPDTMLEGVHKLEPGHLLVWQRGRITTRRWFHLEYRPDHDRSVDEWVETVTASFTETVRRQMVADVPLGAFLSGGLDSSSIVGAMRAAHPQRAISCFTVRSTQQGEDQFADDYPYARRVADHLGVDLRTVDFEPEHIELLPRMIHALDEPDADPAVIPSYLIAREARRAGIPVLLSGTGGDEVFFGYRSHLAHALYGKLDRLPTTPLAWMLRAGARLSGHALGAGAPLPRRLTKFARGLVGRGLARHLEIVDWSNDLARSRVLSADLRQRITRDLARASVPSCMDAYNRAFRGEGSINRHSQLLVDTFLAAHNMLYTDKSTMLEAIEARVPFLDVELMRLAAKIPEDIKLRGRTTKYVLKRAAERWLPRDTIYRKKTGFGAPLRGWIRGALAPTIAELLGPAKVRARGIYDPSGIDQLLRENREGQADHAYLIYALLSLELWMQTFIDRPGEPVSLL